MPRVQRMSTSIGASSSVRRDLHDWRDCGRLGEVVTLDHRVGEGDGAARSDETLTMRGDRPFSRSGRSLVTEDVAGEKVHGELQFVAAAIYSNLNDTDTVMTTSTR